MNSLFSKKCIYGIKALIHISKEQGFINSAVISEKQNIPHAFLRNILLELGKRGLLYMKKGKEGGYKLAKPAEEITMYCIIESLDGPVFSMPCVDSKAQEKCADCISELSCPIKNTMIKVKTQIIDVLKETNLKNASSEILNSTQVKVVSCAV